MLSRREFLLSGATLAEAAPPAAGLRIGVMDGILKLACRPEAIARAKEFGFEGLQVTLGRPDAGNRLPLEEASLQERYLEESRKQNLPLNSAYIDVLHMSCLKSDPAAPAWVERGIEITRRLKAGILMTVFFGKCAIESRRELDYVADLFRDLAPEARRAGVILGFENLLTAEDNARAMDRVASEAFQDLLRRRQRRQPSRSRPGARDSLPGQGPHLPVSFQGRRLSGRREGRLSGRDGRDPGDRLFRLRQPRNRLALRRRRGGSKT